jgi:hypothetical protein
MAGATAWAWPSLSTCTTQGVIVPRAACQTRAVAKPADSTRQPKAIKRQFFA